MWGVVDLTRVELGYLRLVRKEQLVYLAGRNFSPGPAALTPVTARGRAVLYAESVALSDVDTDVLVRFLNACRDATPRGRPGGMSTATPNSMSWPSWKLITLGVFIVRRSWRRARGRGLAREEGCAALAAWANPDPRSA